jgi:hypothetical protein
MMKKGMPLKGLVKSEQKTTGRNRWCFLFVAHIIAATPTTYTPQVILLAKIFTYIPLTSSKSTSPSMSTRIPPLLEQYLALPPEASLILLTSILGASTNWLVLRHLYSYLKTLPDVGVVLVSFMRDGTFWRENASRLVSFGL